MSAPKPTTAPQICEYLDSAVTCEEPAVVWQLDQGVWVQACDGHQRKPRAKENEMPDQDPQDIDIADGDEIPESEEDIDQTAEPFEADE